MLVARFDSFLSLVVKVPRPEHSQIIGVEKCSETTFVSTETVLTAFLQLQTTSLKHGKAVVSSTTSSKSYFLVNISHHSRTINTALTRSSSYCERQTRRLTCSLFSGVILEKVCEYLYYNEKYKGIKDVPDMDLPPELCLELLMAADYLDT